MKFGKKWKNLEGTVKTVNLALLTVKHEKIGKFTQNARVYVQHHIMFPGPYYQLHTAFLLKF
jgi:hypothetical protein